MSRALFFVLFALSFAAYAATFDYKVEIEGVGNREKSILKQLDIETWHGHEQMNLEQLQRLHLQTPARIKELLATEGYFNATVTPSLDQDGGTWIARYDVNLGQPARVNTLELKFTGEIESADEAERRQRLIASWPLAVGQPFNQSTWRSGKNALLEDLSAERYPFAALRQSEARISDDGSGVDITLVFDSGRRIRFGQLRISGLKSYPERIVRNLNRIQPGSDYKRSELLDYQQRLVESGYFSGVLVEASRPLQTDRHVSDVVVQVFELKQQRLRLGAGYSTDTKERVSVDYENRNITTKGWRWNGSIKAEKENQTLATALTFPPSSSGYRDSIGYSFEHESDPDDEVKDLYNNRVFGRRFWGDTRYERVFSIEFLHEIQDRKEAVQKEDESEEEAAEYKIKRLKTTTASTSYNLIKRDVDDLVFPTQGQILDLRSMFGTKLEKDTTPYIRLYGRWNKYLKLGKNWNFVGRAELGGIILQDRKAGQTPSGLDDVPINYKFLGGGDSSVRGYSFESLGEVIEETGDKKKRVRSAATLAIASAEMQYWFQPKWGAAAFIDAGSVDDELLDGPVYPGYGLGLRWRSPVGPLNLDYGYGPKATDKDHHQIHFSIGVAF